MARPIILDKKVVWCVLVTFGLAKAGFPLAYHSLYTLLKIIKETLK